MGIGIGDIANLVLPVIAEAGATTAKPSVAQLALTRRDELNASLQKTTELTPQGGAARKALQKQIGQIDEQLRLMQASDSAAAAKKALEHILANSR